MLFAELWLSIATQLVVGAIFILVQWAHAGWQAFAAWYTLLAVTLVSRGILGSRFYKLMPSGHRLIIWRWWYRLGVLSTSLTFGATSLFFFPQDAVAYQIFGVLLMAGMSAGALTVLVSDFFSFVTYITMLLVPALVMSASYGDTLHLGIALLLFAYYLLLIKSGRRMTELVISSLRLRYENQELVSGLEIEKTRLDNRLGRILNDSSNEIYVLDVASLMCLQVNMGVTQNLGYTAEQMMQMSLLDILNDYDKAKFDCLVQPLINNTQESVFYSGLHRRNDGSIYDIEGRLQLSTEEEPPVFVATAVDVTERKQSERKLLQQANFDQLTVLPNRYYMLHHIDNAFARARRNKKKVALLFMDLDNFKSINDTLGHNMGDELLKQAADRIRSVIRDSDTPARLGGDEFLVMVEQLDEAKQAKLVAQKLVNSFKQPFNIGSREVYTTTSIGISIFPDDGESVELVMQQADTAMYQAKTSGRGNFQYFSQRMQAATEEQMIIESHLRRALENEEFHLVYQPKFNISSNRIIGAEALIRWESPQLGLVPPDRFIPVAESIGLIESIGNWVLSTACSAAQEWQALSALPLHIAVNVSSHQFRTGTLLETVDKVLTSTGLAAESLELEITESLLIQDTSEPLDILNALRGRGIRLALDDFGTGYSSLSYLKRFPLQVLKIDRSFIRDLTVDENDGALVQAIIAMADSLKLDVVAEGVENHAQLEFLRQRGVSLVQGYLFSPPVPENEFRGMLQRSTSESQSLALVV